MEQGEIILYQPNDSLRLEVRLDGDNVWLNRSQLAELFDRDVKTIGKHINNALKEELDNVPVVAKFATTAADGKVYQTEHYNLDMVISVGFRVKSRRGVDFRRWANTILKEYMLKGYAINQRIEQLETICKSYDGVQQCFAMQSGREVRVMVVPEKVDDVLAFKLARDIREKIESEMTYPGQIKVSVIRETRAVEVAK